MARLGKELLLGSSLLCLYIYLVISMTPMTTAPATVSLMIEIPETLHQSMQDYLSTHELWSQERVMQAALSLFLMQNGVNQPQVNKLYLNSLFGCAA
ncbi:Protein of unknown function (DUF2811) [Leptolyngbya sp. PCC 7375]|nr:Protein of unknown function (DUF2811) [Leptolyngbya sp. PCC 7375]